LTRRPYLDNLKVILIAAIIGIHGVLSYVGSDQYWSYADVQEVTLSPVMETALFLLVVPFALFMIALAVAVRPVPLPAEVKALIVAAGGIAGSFALASLLIRRVPGMARIL
jgi:hypothetical protein